MAPGDEARRFFPDFLQSSTGAQLSRSLFDIYRRLVVIINILTFDTLLNKNLFYVRIEFNSQVQRIRFENNFDEAKQIYLPKVNEWRVFQIG